MHVILGIDPGTGITGYGLIALSHGKLTALDFGCIRPKTSLEIPQKYLFLFNAVELLVKKHRPSALAIETQYVKKNVQSAMKLGGARSACLLAGCRENVPVFEYAPSKAKRAVVGNGGASKEQVQRMVQMLLHLSEPPEPEDAADALAIAICHANTISMRGKLCTTM